MAVSLGGMFDGRDTQLKFFKKTKSDTTESGDEKFEFGVEVDELTDEESGETTWYNITFINREESKKHNKTKESKKVIEEKLAEYGIDTKSEPIKSTLDNFLKKWGRDYFIHKKLKAFLSEELERYFFQMLKTDIQGKSDILAIQSKIEEIKAKYSDDPEVVDFKIGQLMKESKPDVKLSVYETAYLWILNFANILGDLEEFKAKLWNKKRKVIKQEYCITMWKLMEYESLIPRQKEMLLEIASNKDQLQEREELLSQWHKHLQGITIDSIKQELETSMINVATNLVVDTKHFDKIWTLYKTLHERGQKKLFEAWCKLDGLLIKSENYQWLNMLVDEYRGKIWCVYIDPPYNTWWDWFSYKDSYKSSSRLSMMNDRINFSTSLLQKKGNFFSHLDENEITKFDRILKKNFDFVKNIIWNKTELSDRTKGKNVTDIKKIHEYIIYAWYENSIFNKSLEWKWIEWWNLKKSQWFNSIYEVRQWYEKWWKDFFWIQMPWWKKIDFEEIDLNEITFRRSNSWDNVRPIIKKGDSVTYISRWDVDAFKNWKLSNINTTNIPRINYKSLIAMPSILEELWTLETAKKDLYEFFPEYLVDKHTPKPEKLCKTIIWTSNGIVLDCFLWTWTTASVAEELWKKYIWIEMLWEYFDELIIPRLKYRIYNTNWYFSYLYLNQYEDRFNEWGYLSRIDSQIHQLEQTDVSSIHDIKNILYPLKELKERIYRLDETS